MFYRIKDKNNIENKNKFTSKYTVNKVKIDYLLLISFNLVIIIIYQVRLYDHSIKKRIRASSKQSLWRIELCHFSRIEYQNSISKC